MKLIEAQMTLIKSIFDPNLRAWELSGDRTWYRCVEDKTSITLQWDETHEGEPTLGSIERRATNETVNLLIHWHPIPVTEGLSAVLWMKAILDSAKIVGEDDEEGNWITCSKELR